MARAWTKAEDDLIRKFYPIVGGRWKGWAKLMPERMPRHDAIAHRAMALGVRCEHAFRYGKGKRRAEILAESML